MESIFQHVITRDTVCACDVCANLGATPVADLVPFCDGPRQILRLYKYYYRDTPNPAEDRSRKLRAGAIGGSEMGTLVGCNPYQKRKDLLASKLGLEKFTGNTATRWGNLMETALFNASDLLLGAESIELGSIPGLRNAAGDIIQMYTPDRLSVIDTRRYRQVIQVWNPDFDLETLALPERAELLVLGEGKCPLNRVPNGDVPKQYLAQPLTGACTIPVTDTCLFVDGMFRKCSVADFGYNTAYDAQFHGVSRCELPPSPVMLGFVGFYLADETLVTPTQVDETNLASWILEQLETHDAETCAALAAAQLSDDAYARVATLLPNLIETLERLRFGGQIASAKYGLDYGDVNDATFEAALARAVDDRFVAGGGLQIYYSPLLPGRHPATEAILGPQIEDAHDWLYREVRRFLSCCRKASAVPLGIMPWKLFRLSLAPLAKQPDYLARLQPTIEEFIAELGALRAAVADLPSDEQPAALRQLYDTRYPKRTYTRRTPVATNGASTAPRINYSQSLLDDFSTL